MSTNTAKEHRKSGAEPGKRGPIGEPGYAEAAWAVRILPDGVPLSKRWRTSVRTYVYLRDSAGNIVLKRTQHIAAEYVKSIGTNVHDVRIVPVRVVEVETPKRCGFAEETAEDGGLSASDGST